MVVAEIVEGGGEGCTGDNTTDSDGSTESVDFLGVLGGGGWVVVGGGVTAGWFRACMAPVSDGVAHSDDSEITAPRDRVIRNDRSDVFLESVRKKDM